MLKLTQKMMALLVLTLFATVATAQVNMNRWIELTVTQGTQIRFMLKADAANTPVRVVSGTQSYDVTVVTAWTGYQNYTAQASTMRVYGDITGFDCDNNTTKITGLDVSNNTALKVLWCSNNSLTALDVRQNTALEVLSCSNNSLTSLDVRQNTALKRLACNNNSLTSLDVRQNAALEDLRCSNNSLTSLDISQNTALTHLHCYNNRLNTLDVSNNTALEELYCYNNSLTSLDVRQNTALKRLGCSGNSLTALDIRQNTALEELGCSNNSLTSLDIRQNTALKFLYCYSNSLTSLDVRQNTALKVLYCYSNNFSTQAIDDIYCALPVRQPSDIARIYPLLNASDPNYATVMATNKQNAINKGWKVRYSAVSDSDILATTGTYVCPGTGGGSVNMNRWVELTVTQGSSIKLGLAAGAENTPVKVVSGTQSYDITVGIDWTDFQDYTAQASVMRVYGDITEFDCSSNTTKITGLNASNNTALRRLFCQNNSLTSLDVRQNTALTYLDCAANNFTTQAIDDIYCALPVRQPSDNARIWPLLNASDPNHTTVMATNKQNAIDKGWKVQYYGGADIPATTGTYICGVSTGLELAESRSGLLIYPNPATDVITIETEAAGSAITLTDLTGRTLMTATATTPKTVLNISHLPAGTYTIRVGESVGKVVKREAP